MATPAKALSERCVNTIRFLSIDAIQQANSGHPGICMGAAPAAFVLWDRFLRHNPKNPNWFNRDRFVLSAGHGSMLLYSLLHLTGYDSVTIDEIKRFRQWGSKTPGHPESHLTAGVEVSTGPLGQGLANAVGLAIAEAHLAARFNEPDCAIVDHYTYTLAGDGCQMEGISHEAVSLAGHLGLGKLIALYDDNKVSIDGSTEIAFTEDVGRRYEACGWHVQTVEHGDTDLEAIARAIEAAQAATDRPSLIKVRTTIGYGSPAKAGSSDCHGAPLGEDEVVATRQALGWDAPPFTVPADVGTHMQRAIERGREQETRWQGILETYRGRYPDEAAELERMLSGELPAGWEAALPSFTPNDPKKATRVHSGTCLNALAERVGGLIGGSADLAPSNKSIIGISGDFQRGAYHNRNLRFGVREHAMGAICNGLALHRSGLLPYCATFMVFTDYMRSSIRMSALSGAPVLYIMTHDSVAVGEDGPTHQPIEHVAMLRAMPGLKVLRPADGNETAGAYKAALGDRTRPSLLALSRQGVPHLAGTSADAVARGAYVLSDSDAAPELILIGTGAELSLCVGAAEQLRAEGRAVRVVSMPCWELFEEQDAAYRESVLPAGVERRLAVEAGTSFGWHKWVGRRGDTVSIDRFGQSAPGAVCLEQFGFTADNVLAKARSLLAR